MISSPLLSEIKKIRHGFGTKDTVGLPDRIVTARQVHGTEVLFVEKAGVAPEGGFDILITDRPGIPIAVRTADCLPILIAEPAAGLVAAVHAGWRGTLKRVVQRAVREIVGRGGHAEDIYAAMGPCIEARCLEVGPEVSASGRFDLRGANFQQMVEMGVRPERIDRTLLCTHCRSDLFHSWRRDNESAGRMVNFIELLG